MISNSTYLLDFLFRYSYIIYNNTDVARVSINGRTISVVYTQSQPKKITMVGSNPYNIPYIYIYIERWIGRKYVGYTHTNFPKKKHRRISSSKERSGSHLQMRHANWTSSTSAWKELYNTPSQGKRMIVTTTVVVSI